MQGSNWLKFQVIFVCLIFYRLLHLFGISVLIEIEITKLQTNFAMIAVYIGISTANSFIYHFVGLGLCIPLSPDYHFMV